MALLSKKEFATFCNLATKDLSNYIKRGNVIVGADELIDDQAPKNKAFIMKRMANREPAAATQPTAVTDVSYTPPAEGAKAVIMVNGKAIPDYAHSETVLKYLDTLKREQEVSLLKIKEDKLRGEVIPSELMKPLFLRHNQSILTAVKNANDELLRLFSKKKGMNANEVAEMRGAMVRLLNTAMAKAADSSIKEVELIINDFSEKRGVGERA